MSSRYELAEEFVIDTRGPKKRGWSPVQNASKSLMEAITEVYESQWTGSEVLYGQAKTIDTQYQQFSYKLADQVLKQLDTYALQFPEMKKKIDKRGRKLVDYDSQRHSFQSLQANAAKRKDDLKVTRGREQLEEAKSTYEVLNSELHDELPALYDSRILFLVTNLQTLFACEQQFHSETSKVYAELEAIVDKLATESQRGSYTLKKINANSNPSSPQQSPVKANLSIVNNVTNGSANANGHTSAQNVLPSPRTPSPNQQMPAQPEDDEPSYQNTDVVKAAAAAKAPTTNGIGSVSAVKHEPELNGSPAATAAVLSLNAPKENGQPAAATVTEGVPVTTNGTLHPSHSQPSTNQLPQPDQHNQTQTTANGLASSLTSSAQGAQENDLPETKPASATTDAAPAATATADTAASANADAAIPTPTTTGAAAVSQTIGTVSLPHFHHPHHSHHHPHHGRSHQNLPPVYQYRKAPEQSAPLATSFSLRIPSTPVTLTEQHHVYRSTVPPSQAAGSGRTQDKVTQTPPPPPPPSLPAASSLALVAPKPSSSSVQFAMPPQASEAARSFSPARFTGLNSSYCTNSGLYSNVPAQQQQHYSYPSFPYGANRNLNSLNNNSNNANTRPSPLFIAQQPQQPHFSTRVSLNNNSSKLDILYDIPVGATTTDLPPGVLYRVKATYKYVREDVDELSFEVGDVINVVEYEDPEDQEEGWLMGTKEGTNEKGMFPANFTRPL
uniref:Uncharacterized protein n=1 Tax=Anopheles epiroticus TaxID=199890 RepID=A0A182PMK8_9DIPT